MPAGICAFFISGGFFEFPLVFKKRKPDTVGNNHITYSSVLSDRKPIDLSYLEELSMGDESMIIEMIELFLEKSPGNVDAIHRHYRDEEWKKLGEAAHKFKPTLDYMGMEETRERLEAVERLVNNGEPEDPERLKERIDEIEDQCKQAYGLLKKKLSQLKDKR